MVNGHYSSCFKIGRWARKGDPLSPYLYLICAEVLSIIIQEKEEKNQRHENINDMEVLISQFADDTTLCIDGSEESFNESLQSHRKIALISGLKINYEKTQLVWIGSRKKTSGEILRDRTICRDPGIFKVLGIKFSTDITQITSANYEGRLTEIKRILYAWSKRQNASLGELYSD